jgi:AcrR family transcriptional regulator
MPKLWSETIATHRRVVREAAIEATAALVAEGGLRSVTMSEIAQRTGIGRATLYKHFPDVGAILRAWHDRQLARHLEAVASARDHASGPAARLRAVLNTFANIAHHSRGHADTDIATKLHHDEQVARVGTEFDRLLCDVLADAVTAGLVRNDVPPKELAAYCRNALAAAGDLPSASAVRRLVEVTLAGLMPPQQSR